MIAALLGLKHLRSLDLEGTRFDDTLADQLSVSTTLESLEVGATRITHVGLRSLLRMKQLRALDLWATDLSEADLQMLHKLPSLEYVSVGGYQGCTLRAAKIVGLLTSLPSLNRVWLDGIKLSPMQRSTLESKIPSVRISY